MTEEKHKRPPDWSRDETILALDLYIRSGGKFLEPSHTDVIHLSETLNGLYRSDAKSPKFRNPNGISKKLANFWRFDPQYIAKGTKGLSHGAKEEENVWNEFANDPARLRQVALAIQSCASAIEAFEEIPDEPEIEEATEGKLLTRTHLKRERDPTIADKKKKKVLKNHGKLECEACGFVFEEKYGTRGQGFIECHHTKSLSEYEGEQKTKLEDLALLCANCHRMIHAKKPWLSLDQLRKLIGN